MKVIDQVYRRNPAFLPSLSHLLASVLWYEEKRPHDAGI